MMPDALRPFLSRYAAIVVTYFAGWLTVRFGLDLSADLRTLLQDTLVVIAVSLATYVTTHRLADKKLNPADAASSHLATVGKAEVKEIKATAETVESLKQFRAPTE